MPAFVVNEQRLDPYPGYSFRVHLNGRPVPLIHRVTGLTWSASAKPPQPPGRPPRDDDDEPEKPAGPIEALGDLLTDGAKAVGDFFGDLLGGGGSSENDRAGRSSSGRPRSPIPVVGAWTPLVIERGRSHDETFEVWATAAMQGVDASLGLRVELANEAGQLVMAWRVLEALPIAYEPVVLLDANASSPAIERIVVSYVAAVWDPDVVEPTEPQFE